MLKAHMKRLKEQQEDDFPAFPIHSIKQMKSRHGWSIWLMTQHTRKTPIITSHCNTG
jgi:hypothetical protein